MIQTELMNNQIVIVIYFLYQIFLVSLHYLNRRQDIFYTDVSEFCNDFWVVVSFFAYFEGVFLRSGKYKSIIINE